MILPMFCPCASNQPQTRYIPVKALKICKSTNAFTYSPVLGADFKNNETTKQLNNLYLDQ